MGLTRLRLGVILPDVNVPVWVARTLEQIKNSSFAEVISLAFAEDANGEASGIYDKYFQLDQRLFRPSPSPWERRDVRQILQTTQLIGETLHERIARFKSMRLDVILNLSLNELPRSIYDAARFGVWSLRCNDGRVTTGTNAGWFDLLKDESLIHCTVEAQRGETVKAVARSVMATHPYSFTHDQKSFLWRASALIPRALRNLHSKGEAEFFSKAELLSQTKKFQRPATSQIIAFAWKRVIKKIENKTWWHWFPHCWALMAGVRAEGEKLTWNGFSLKVPPRGAFWADPFIMERQGRSYIFFEEYIYKTQRGRISFAEIQKDASMGEAQVALERPYHLSYPFLFEHRGEFYMIPETAQNRTIEIYRCARFPDQWEFHKTLVKDVRAVDATLVEHSALWWMFVNLAGEGGSTWDELHLFYSDDPLSDRWTPHPLNPVVSDVRSARPAGRLFRRDGLLLRPSQDSSIRYGYALNLNRITKLTRNEYQEELLERLEPPKNGNILAVHTFNFWNELTVIDVLLKK